MLLAIDPGSDKTGTAVLQKDGTLVTKKIVMTTKLSTYLDEIFQQFPFTHIVMGDGTNHKKLQPLVEDWISRQEASIGFSLVDERYTTVEGRKLYWQHTPRHGWRRLVPLTFQYPPEPVDDYVAWIIGCRYLERQERL
jgi:RNase H-fold protein (predicted Holliday junction resolvase)